MIICSSRIYKYNGWTFEWHNWCGPHPVNKDGELRKTPPGRKFFKDIEAFCKMSTEERKQYMVLDGGCQVIN